MSQIGGGTYNVNNVIIEALLKAPPKTPRLVARDQLTRLRQQFARPRGINAAYDVLEAEHTVFLTGEPGSGRSSAAKVLLCELPRGRGYLPRAHSRERGRGLEPAAGSHR